MKLNVLTIALAATAFGALAASAQTTVIEERRDPALINGSRRMRIAKGSGVTTSDVNALLKQFKMVQQMMRSAGKGKMPKLPAGMDLSG